VLNTELESHEHRVLRLSPYNSELNPIEKIWTLVKNWVATRNVSFKAKEVEKLTKKRFEAITAEGRSKICEHVDKIVAEYLQKELMFDQAFDELIFTVNTGDSDEFSESEHDNTDSEYWISLFIMIKLFLQYFLLL
jgi:hypothetical protein